MLNRCLMVVVALTVNGAIGVGQVRQGINKIEIYGVGARSCGLWLEARAGQADVSDVRHLQFESWVEGYLTGFNAFSQNGTGSIYRTDVAGMKGFMDKFCGEHPTANFVSAVGAFIIDQGGKLK